MAQGHVRHAVVAGAEVEEVVEEEAVAGLKVATRSIYRRGFKW
jgi:hypothetical protein